jgi:hypothetical protein
MSEERRKILEMLSDGKIDLDAAERLLSALNSSKKGTQSSGAMRSKPKYLCVRVVPSPDNPKGDRVNVRVPLNLIRAGMKWMTLIPSEAKGQVETAFKEKGMDMDLNRMTADDLEMLIQNLNELEVEVEGKDNVRVFCE